MEWTTEQPTEPGLYWVVIKSSYGLGNFVDLKNIEISEDGNPYYEVSDEYVWGGIDRICDFSDISHFMGPIIPPEMPK